MLNFCASRGDGPLHHGAEGDRVTEFVDRSDAVLPIVPRLALHQIDRARFGPKAKAFPFVAVTAAQAELSGAAEREPEHLVEISLVAMPADADAGLVFRAKHLTHAGLAQIAEG